jgi:hypothetical protein
MYVIIITSFLHSLAGTIYPKNKKNIAPAGRAISLKLRVSKFMNKFLCSLQILLRFWSIFFFFFFNEGF